MCSDICPKLTVTLSENVRFSEHIMSAAISFPESSFPLTSGQKTRALGATISGMRRRCRLRSEITRIRLYQNGCSQSSRFLTAGQGERRIWERDCVGGQISEYISSPDGGKGKVCMRANCKWPIRPELSWFL